VELDLEIYENILKSKVLKRAFYFSLTGGESQLSNKFIPLLELIHKYKPHAIVQTNISGWYPERHFEIAKVGKTLFKERFRVDISVDGTEEYYKKVRLTPNGWEKVKRTTELLKSLGVSIRYVMIVCRENMYSIEEFVELCRERGVGWYIGFYVENEIFNNSGKGNYLSNEEIEIVEKSLRKIGFLNTKHAVNWEWAKRIYRNEVPLFDCYMGKRSIVIDYDGEVYPCGGGTESHLHKLLSMGNVKKFEGNLDKLLYSERALKVLKNIEEKKCQPCNLLCAHKVIFPWGKGTGM
jgi:radical SAM protein with 4Fe4S-binding SPASM domain